MNWRGLRRLIWLAPEDRWNGDLLFGPLAVALGVWIADTAANWILGLAAVLVVGVLRQVVFHFLVRRRRSP